MGEGAQRRPGLESGTLDDVDFDDLLREVLARVHGVLDEQQRLRLLLDAVVTMAADLSLDSVLSRIVSIASALVDARYAALGVLAKGPDRRLRTFIHHGMGTDVVRRIGDLPTGHGLLGLLIDEPTPIRLHDLGAHPTSYGFPEHHPPMQSFLGVPIRTRERVFGNLYLTEKAGGVDFTENDERIVVALAAAAGVAIENAHLYEEAAHRQAWLAATAEITAVMADDSTSERALQAVADHARAVSGADVAWVVTGCDAASLHLEVVSGAPADPGAMRALPMSSSLASIVLRTGEAMTVDDVAADPRAVDPSSIDGWPTLGPVMLLPLRSGEEVEGVLSLGWTPENAESFRQVGTVLPASFAEHATLALQVARARDDKQRLALFEDRDRIGRDLHDLVIQQLFAVGLILQSTALSTTDERTAARIDGVVDDIDRTIKDIRRTIFSLGTLDTSLDVQSEIERLVRRAGATMKLRPTLRTEGPVRTAVDGDLVPDLLAVLGEALSNASRHAHATAVDVLVTVSAGRVVLCVSDDGKGMAEEILEGGLGNMRARARKWDGTFVVESSSGGGTKVTWSVPLADPRVARADHQDEGSRQGARSS